MSDIRNLQELAGIYKPVVQENLQQHNYVFIIIDPQSGEFTEYYRGSPLQIMQKLERDPENSMIADVLKKQNFGAMENVDGRLSFKYDDHIYAFVPL